AALHHLLPLAGALARRHGVHVEAALGALGRNREETRLLGERERAHDSVIVFLARAHEDDAAARAGELGHLVEREAEHLAAPGGDYHRRAGDRLDRHDLVALADARHAPPRARRLREIGRGAEAVALRGGGPPGGPAASAPPWRGRVELGSFTSRTRFSHPSRDRMTVASSCTM